MKSAVREMQEEDIEPIVAYFASASSEFLASMGVDINKVPDKHTWMKLLSEELNKTYETVPGWINFRQQVNRYRMARDKFETLSTK